MSSLPDVELIYSDNPGSLPATYVVDNDFGVQSIVARVDGSGAGSNFLPTLSVYSQDGKLIARVPTITNYAVGDTGVVTWSPFLGQGGEPLSQAILGCKVEKTAGHNENVANSPFYTLTPTFDTTDFNTGLSFPGSDSGHIRMPAAGLALIVGTISFVSNATGNRGLQINRNNNLTIAYAQGPADTNGDHQITIAGLDQCIATHEYSLACQQDSGGVLAVNAGFLSVFLFAVG